jgi:hypothetical protein
MNSAFEMASVNNHLKVWYWTNFATLTLCRNFWMAGAVFWITAKLSIQT